MNGIAGLLSILAGAWFAWNFGGSLSWWFGWTQSYWLGPLLVFFASYLTINAILGSALSVLQLAGGGIWTATPVRWVVGKLAALALWAGAVWIIGLFLPLAGLNWRMILAVALQGLRDDRAAALGVSGLNDWQKQWIAWSFDNISGIAMAAALSLVAGTAIQTLIPWEKSRSPVSRVRCAICGGP